MFRIILVLLCLRLMASDRVHRPGHTDRYSSLINLADCKACNAAVYINSAMDGIDSPVHCAGVLITRQIVLTSAGCYAKSGEKYPGEKTYLVVGSQNPHLTDEPNYGELFYVINHKYVTPPGEGNLRRFTLLLLKLDRRIQYRKDLYPIPIGLHMEISWDRLRWHQGIGIVAYGNPTNYTIGLLHATSAFELKGSEDRCEERQPSVRDLKRKVGNAYYEDYWCLYTVDFWTGYGQEDHYQYVMTKTDLGAPIMHWQRNRLMGIVVTNEVTVGDDTLYYIMKDTTRKLINQLAKTL